MDYWYKKFGPLYSLWLGNQLFVIITDPGITKDLFVTNGAVFSSVSQSSPAAQNKRILANSIVIPEEGDVYQVPDGICREGNNCYSVQRSLVSIESKEYTPNILTLLLGASTARSRQRGSISAP